MKHTNGSAYKVLVYTLQAINPLDDGIGELTIDEIAAELCQLNPYDVDDESFFIEHKESFDLAHRIYRGYGING